MIAPISTFRPQLDPLATILQGGTNVLNNALNNAIQVGRDQANRQFNQERDFIAEQRQEINLQQRRSENSFNAARDNRNFLNTLYENGRQLDQSDARIDLQGQQVVQRDRELGFKEDDRRIQAEERERTLARQQDLENNLAIFGDTNASEDDRRIARSRITALAGRDPGDSSATQQAGEQRLIDIARELASPDLTAERQATLLQEQSNLTGRAPNYLGTDRVEQTSETQNPLLADSALGSALGVAVGEGLTGSSSGTAATDISSSEQSASTSTSSSASAGQEADARTNNGRLFQHSSTNSADRIPAEPNNPALSFDIDPNNPTAIPKISDRSEFGFTEQDQRTFERFAQAAGAASADNPEQAQAIFDRGRDLFTSARADAIDFADSAMNPGNSAPGLNPQLANLDSESVKDKIGIESRKLAEMIADENLDSDPSNRFAEFGLSEVFRKTGKGSTKVRTKITRDLEGYIERIIKARIRSISSERQSAEDSRQSDFNDALDESDPLSSIFR